MIIRRPRAETRRGADTMKRILLFLFFLILAGGVALLSAIFYLAKDLPSVEQISERSIAQSTKIYDRTGKTIIYEISAGQKRTVIPLDEIPQLVKDATVLIEDENFYEGPGVDWRGILRAVWMNVTRGRIVQGGSTITQQLARNAFLSSEQTFSRKIRELILAVQLARRYSKDKILEFYLNEIPYGPTAYGIEAASRGYFGKSAKDLTLGEGTLLVALPRAPSYYSPFGNHVDELMARREHILNKMLDAGKIDAEQLRAALGAKLEFQPRGEGGTATHFIMAVQDYLVQKYGEEAVRTGGLRVVTTLDPRFQEIAERVVAEGAAQNEKLYDGKNAALVAEDPKTGQILAMVGSRNYFEVENEGNFNVATQGRRQPGSALKPFVYLAALEKGYTPETVVFDVPMEFAANNPNCPAIVDMKNENDKCYHPEDFDGKTRGPVSFRTALAQSLNIPAVQALYLVGLEGALETVGRVGITTLKDPRRYGLSLVLGGGEVRLIELVGGYSVLANDGVRREQTMILEVKDSSGNVLESYQEQDGPEQAIGPQPVRLINDILSDASARSGLFQNSLKLTVFPNYDVALKTGTSNDYRDAWTVGYTPFLAVGVWAGNNDNAPMHRSGSSILAALPIWHSFMAEALPSYAPETFPRPEQISPAKPILRGEYLLDGKPHSTLFYIDRRDPIGPPPANPSADPQFLNWETAVQEWAKTNFTPSQASQTGGPLAPPRVSITEPRSGAFVGSQIAVDALIQPNLPVMKIRILWNGALIQEIPGPFILAHRLNQQIIPSGFQLQNVLRIEAVDMGGEAGSAEVVVYK